MSTYLLCVCQIINFKNFLNINPTYSIYARTSSLDRYPYITLSYSGYLISCPVTDNILYLLSSVFGCAPQLSKYALAYVIQLWA